METKCELCGILHSTEQEEVECFMTNQSVGICPFCFASHPENEWDNCYQEANLPKQQQTQEAQTTQALNPYISKVIQALIGVADLEGFEIGDKTGTVSFPGLRVNLEFTEKLN